MTPTPPPSFAPNAPTHIGPGNDPQKCDRLIESKKREIVLLQLLKSLGNHLGDRINGSNRTCRAMGEVREYLDSILSKFVLTPSKNRCVSNNSNSNCPNDFRWSKYF